MAGKNSAACKHGQLSITRSLASFLLPQQHIDVSAPIIKDYSHHFGCYCCGACSSEKREED